MATLTIRNFDDTLKTQLRIEAAQHGHSMEEEVRIILRRALTHPERSGGLGNVLSELMYGITRFPDGRRKAGLHEAALSMLEDEFAGRVLAFDAAAAVQYGVLAPHAIRQAARSASLMRKLRQSAGIKVQCLQPATKRTLRQRVSLYSTLGQRRNRRRLKDSIAIEPKRRSQPPLWLVTLHHSIKFAP